MIFTALLFILALYLRLIIYEEETSVIRILMYFKIQSDQPRITRNPLKSQIFHLFTKSSSEHVLTMI